MNKGELEHRFTFHPARDDQVPRYESIRAKAGELADFIDEVAPDGREKSLAVTHLEETVFWANAAIARGEADRVNLEPVDDPRPVELDTPETDEPTPGPIDQGGPPNPDNAGADDQPPDAGAGDQPPDTDAAKCPACGGRGCPVCRYSGRAS